MSFGVQVVLKLKGYLLRVDIMKGILGVKIFDPNLKVMTSLVGKKDGHEIFECYKLQNEEIRNVLNKSITNNDYVNYARDDEYEVEVLTVVFGSVDDNWVFDSNCTYHICSHRDWFTTFKSIRNAESVRGFDCSPCKIEDVGIIRIKMFDGMIQTLINVQYIPTMKRNLIFLSMFGDKDYNFSGGGSVLKIIKGLSFD